VLKLRFKLRLMNLRSHPFVGNDIRIKLWNFFFFWLNLNPKLESWINVQIQIAIGGSHNREELHNIDFIPWCGWRILVTKIESLFFSTYNYFAHSLKWHVELTKLVELLECKGNKIFNNIKTHWISILSPSNKNLVEYHSLVVK